MHVSKKRPTSVEPRLNGCLPYNSTWFRTVRLSRMSLSPEMQTLQGQALLRSPRASAIISSLAISFASRALLLREEPTAMYPGTASIIQCVA